MSSAFATVAPILKSEFDTEFAVEGWTLEYDKPHDSLGFDRTHIGVYPVEDVVRPGNSIIQETIVEVKFLGWWDKQINPAQVVNPLVITELAERYRSALGRSNSKDPGIREMWYFDVRRVLYPDDPTGNKTRFVMTVRAFGNNSGLIETFA
jgi:hypothetical protein